MMALENIVKHIILDVSKSRYVSVIVKQNDINIRTIIVKVADNGRPYFVDNTIKPRIKCKKEDGTYVINDCTVLEDGTVQIDVTDQMTACDGIHECELALLDGYSEQVLYTMNFVISVRKAPFSDDEISSTNEFIALENALMKADSWSYEILSDTPPTEQRDGDYWTRLL